MIIQFNFKNYKSFRDEATLDLSATKMTEFSERVVSIGGEKILPVAAVYGANASGKSNVYGAFEYMSDYVVNSFKYGDEVKNFDEIRPHPFMFDLNQKIQIPALKFILQCREIKQRKAITTVSVWEKRALQRSG